MKVLPGVVASAVLWLAAGPALAQDLIVCDDPGVISGDRLICGGREIRLQGVAAPPSGHADFIASRDGLARLVRFREVVCRVRRSLGPDADEAQCRVGARDLGAAQVRDGLATAVG